MLGSWHDFFVAEAGAAAALAGLLFVSASINLERILAFKALPTRVIEALTNFLSVLAVATFALTPDQPLPSYGAEFAAIGLLTWAIQTRALIKTRADTAKHQSLWVRRFINQAPALPFLIAGVLMLNGHPEGIYWMLPGTLLSFASGLVTSWVLLIEIQR